MQASLVTRSLAQAQIRQNGASHECSNDVTPSRSEGRTMNISDAAEATGLSVKTIRYYEREGLIAPDREGNGYRNFDASDVRMLRFIHRARNFGFSISDCRRLVAYYEDSGRASADVKAIARKRLHAISRQIDNLRSQQKQLSSLVEDCSGDESPKCSIINGLAGEEICPPNDPEYR